MTCINETGSEAVFYLQYSSTKGKHVLSEESGGQDLLLVSRSHSPTVRHEDLSCEYMYVCVHAVLCYVRTCVILLNHSLFLETGPSKGLVLTDHSFCPSRLTRSR